MRKIRSLWENRDLYVVIAALMDMTCDILFSLFLKFFSLPQSFFCVYHLLSRYHFLINAFDLFQPAAGIWKMSGVLRQNKRICLEIIADRKDLISSERGFQHSLSNMLKRFNHAESCCIPGSDSHVQNQIMNLSCCI